MLQAVCRSCAMMLLVVPSLLFSQGRSRLVGTVTDGARAPLGFVTVRVFSPKNPALPLQSTYTKEDGSFAFTKLDTGRYMLVLAHTGYAEKKQPVRITAADAATTLPAIQLVPVTGNLQGVTVKAQRPLIEQADDKIVFNVEDDPTTKTETAIDILRKTPFVSVDGEDNVKVNGKGNFKVLLNGRETSMFARNLKEALRGFPGALIAKIEVITSPSAKYDGEGIGGLINIITKKKVVGYNGSINSFSRTIDKLNNLGINANAKFGKMGFSVFFATADLRPVNQEVFSTTIPTVPTAYTKRSMNGRQANSGSRRFGNGELSFELDSLNTISAYGNVNGGSNTATSKQDIVTSYTSAPSTTSMFQLENTNTNPGVSVGTDYIRKFKKNKEREMSVRFFGEFGKNTSYMNSFQDNPGTDRYIINNSLSRNNQYTIQTDQVIPVKNGGKLEAGVKAILRRASSDFESMVKYDASQKYSPNPSNTDHFKYRQDVLGVYGMYNFRINKSNVRIGARVEQTNVNGDFISSNTKVDQSYTTVLPNVQVTRKMSRLVTLVMTYSKRLARPFISDLNPFVNNNDSLNISYGNPGLNPQTIHGLSFQTRIVNKSTFAGINIEGTYSGNKILDYAFFDPATGITKTTSLNIGKEYQASLNLNLGTKFTPKWSYNLNAAMRYARVINNTKGSESNDGFGGSVFMNSSYAFNKRFVVSSLFGFWQDPVTIQTTFPFGTWYNIAFAHRFINNKLNVSLRFVNYLEKTRDFKTVTRDPNFTTTNINRQIRRGLALALTWNFGKLTESVSKKKGVNNDDQLVKPQPTTGAN